MAKLNNKNKEISSIVNDIRAEYCPMCGAEIIVDGVACPVCGFLDGFEDESVEDYIPIADNGNVEKNEVEEDLMDIINGLEDPVVEPYEKWFDDHIEVIPFAMGCTCHRCLEGRQTCGETIKVLAYRKGETRPLPTGGVSTSRGFRFEFPDGTQMTEDDELWFEVGTGLEDVRDGYFQSDWEELWEKFPL